MKSFEELEENDLTNINEKAVDNGDESFIEEDPEIVRRQEESLNIHNETSHILADYLASGNAEGFYYYIRDALWQYEEDKANGKETLEFHQTPKGSAIDGMLQTLSKMDEEESLAFIYRLLNKNEEMTENFLMEAGDDYDVIKVQIQKGEMPGLSGMEKESELIGPLAKKITLEKTEAGKRYTFEKNTVASTLSMIGIDSNLDELKVNAKQFAAQDKNGVKDYDPETKKRYTELFDEEDLINPADLSGKVRQPDKGLEQEMKKAYPEAMKQVEEKRKQCEQIGQNKEQLRKFMFDSRRLVDETSYLIRFFEKDKSKRTDLKDADKHKEYNEICRLLTDISDRSRYETSPRDLKEKLEAAKQAAKNYVDTHAGLTNITKGWTKEGRERIAFAQKIHDALDARLKKYGPVFDTAQNCLGEDKNIGAALKTSSLGQRNAYSVIEDYKLLALDKVKARETMKNEPVNLETVLQISQDKLKKEPDQEETRNKSLAAVYAVHEVKGNLQKYKNITGQGFKNLTEEILKKESFQKTLKNSNGQDLIKNALEGNGEKLYTQVKANEKTHVMSK